MLIIGEKSDLSGRIGREIAFLFLFIFIIMSFVNMDVLIRSCDKEGNKICRNDEMQSLE